MQPSKLASAVTCCALLLATQPMQAEDAHDGFAREAEPELRVGARVRLDRDGKTMTGRVLSFSERDLLLEVRKGDPPLELRRADVRGLQVAVGRRGRAKGGAIVGGILFAIPGAWTGFVLSEFKCWECGRAPASWQARGALAGGAAVGLVGAGLGALIGNAFRTDNWQPVESRRLSVELAPTQRGVGASVSFRF